MSYHIPWGRFFLFLHVLCVLLTNIHHTSYGCSVEERAALMELRSSLERANTTAPRSWGRGGDCCSWERVNCSGSGSARRVSHLYLSKLYDISTFPSTYTGRLFWSFNTTVFSAFSELQSLDLSSNSPSTLGSDGLVGLNLTKLQYLNLSSNWLGESILAPLGELVSLQVLDLNFNGMRGVLPVAVFENLRNLRELNLSDNQFNGSLPKNLLVLPHLKILDLSQNSLVGGIPISSFSDDELASLEVLNLSNNNMNGTLPTEQVEDTRGFTFDTKGNQYTYGFNFFDVMSGIDLCMNMLSGEIPWELGNLSHIKSLNLSNNFFSGQIPVSFANMSDIESLDLSHNELTGSIPWQLTKLWMLESFSVAYNNLSGCIPNSGQFGSFTAESYQGNGNLHSMSQGGGCSSHGSGADDMPVEGSDRIEDDPVLYAVSAASFVLAFWATVAFIVCHPVGRLVILR
nr:unnamed protein product [Digitaria exilis]CAB3470228.1 unnamed protein product [Digitaria exilis]